MRSVGSEPAKRDPGRPGLAALPAELRSGSRNGQGRRRESSRTAGRAGPAPIEISRRVLGVLLLTALLALALLVVLAPGVLLVASGGLALALVLSFPVRALSRFMPRPLAVAATFLALVSSAILALVVLIPLLSDQLRNLLGAAPAAIGDASGVLRGLMGALAELGLLSGTPDEALNRAEGYVLERLQELAGELLGGLGGFISGAVGLGIGIFGALVVAAYLLLDERKIKAAYLKAVPARRRRDARDLWDAFGLSLSRYLGGLAFVMAIQGVLSGVALWLLGVPYSALLGSWVAMTAVVPFLGAVVGAIPALILASLVSPAAALGTAIAFLAIQTLEGNVLTPRIQGKAVNVHRILILLAVVGGGQVAGMVGVVLAVPALAAAKVLLDFLRPRLRVQHSDESVHDAASQALPHETSDLQSKDRSEEVSA